MTIFCTACGDPMTMAPARARRGPVSCPGCHALVDVHTLTTRASVAPAPTLTDGLRVGDELGGFRVEAEIGRGGMGIVYRGRQISLDRPVAIKVLPRELLSSDELRARFEREADALAQLSHPGVVAVYDRGRTEGSYYFVMEHVAGRTLREVMNGEELEPAGAADVAASVLDALAHAHGRGVIHRDLKPENILVDASGRIKVSDFGIAHLRGREAAANLTSTRTSLGTVHYMAPEQAMDAGSVDERADLYSVGVLVYEMLTGRLPIGAFRSPSELRPGIDPRWDDLVLQALQPDPSDRPGSAVEMLACVQDIVSTGFRPQLVRPGGTVVRIAAPRPGGTFARTPASRSGGTLVRTGHGSLAMTPVPTVEGARSRLTHAAILLPVLLLAGGVGIGGGYAIHRVRAVVAPPDRVGSSPGQGLETPDRRPEMPATRPAAPPVTSVTADAARTGAAQDSGAAAVPGSRPAIAREAGGVDAAMGARAADREAARKREAEAERDAQRRADEARRRAKAEEARRIERAAEERRLAARKAQQIEDVRRKRAEAQRREDALAARREEERRLARIEEARREEARKQQELELERERARIEQARREQEERLQQERARIDEARREQEAAALAKAAVELHKKHLNMFFSKKRRR